AAYGIQVNHFTVLFNSLKTFSTLAELNEFLRQNGFTLNAAGGEIKGTPKDGLEQSSTMARAVPWKFSGGEEHLIPGCYYEFARRYPTATGGLFQGFIPKSADKIFESTFDKKPSRA
ncbi:MAG: 2-oxoadipate dioxygenase/decarboxylase family protein, partial [Bdellovibrionota bacterium]